MLKVLRVCYTPALALYLLLRLLGSGNAPQLVEGVHIEWQIIEFAVIVCYRRVDIWHKLDNGIDPLPDLLIRGVEDMRAVVMDCHTVIIGTIEVAADVITAVDDLHPLTRLHGAPSHHRAEEPRANDKVVVISAILPAQHSLGTRSDIQGAPTDG